MNKLIKNFDAKADKSRFWVAIKRRYVRFISYNKAFTLAEVLITLGIIGVVAAITIPTLMAKYQQQVMITRLKKTYSVLQNAFEMAKINNGDYETWSWNDYPTTNGERTQYFWNHYLLPHLKVTKVCVPASRECFSGDVKYLNGTSGNLTFRNTHVTYILNDGTSIYSWTGADQYNPHAYIYVDINGLAKPNIVGKDVFVLFFTKKGNNVSSMYSYAVQDDEGNLTDTSDNNYSNTYYKLIFSGENGAPVENYMNPNVVIHYSDDSIGKLSSCSKTCKTSTCGMLCGAAIKANNWEIPENYPW